MNKVEVKIEELNYSIKKWFIIKLILWILLMGVFAMITFSCTQKDPMVTLNGKRYKLVKVVKIQESDYRNTYFLGHDSLVYCVNQGSYKVGDTLKCLDGSCISHF